LEIGQGVAGAGDGQSGGERGVMSDRWQQIEELYHAAREDRTVLDQADPELRREVESLLAREKGAGFLESPALEVAAQQLAADRGQDLIGRRIGSYEILSLLGAGGMGAVYRAKDTKLKREVALKVLPEAFAGDPERMARFQREAEVSRWPSPISAASSTWHAPSPDIWFPSPRPPAPRFAPASTESSTPCSSLNMSSKCSVVLCPQALHALRLPASPIASSKSLPKLANSPQPKIGHRLAGYVGHSSPPFCGSPKLCAKPRI
jgi:hypothetical protein